MTVKSRALGRRADITLYVPDAPTIQTLLILLHGVYGSHWAWTQKAGVHQLAESMIAAGEIQPMAIAMPSDGLWGDGSGYLPHPEHDAETWIVEEVTRAAMEAISQLVPEPKIALAGLSMGGYAALRLGAKYAERFVAISAHSAVTTIEEMAQFVEEPIEHYLRNTPKEQAAPFYWQRQRREHLPPLRFDCGTADHLLEGNRRLHAALEEQGIQHIYQEFPGGHEWLYWEKHVRETLKFVDQHVADAREV